MITTLESKGGEHVPQTPSCAIAQFCFRLESYPLMKKEAWYLNQILKKWIRFTNPNKSHFLRLA